MAEIETSDFKVGNTTFSSCYFITIPDYDVPIPECHSSGPIIDPICVPLSTIVNFIERGLHPQFKDNSKCESIYYFLIEYNEIARKINSEAGEVLNPIAQKAEDYFKLKLGYIESVNKHKEELEKENPFKKKIVTSNSDAIGAKYSNNSITNRLFKKKQKDKKPVPHDYKLYDMFSMPESISSDGRIIIDPNTIGGNTMPDFYDNMDFGN